MARTLNLPEKYRGCWIEGSRGWRGTGYLVQIAEEYGMRLSKDDREIVTSYMQSADSVTLSTGETLDATEISGAVIDQGELADRAEQWLNDKVAPKGWAFGWVDGEFFFWPDEEWQEI